MIIEQSTGGYAGAMTGEYPDHAAVPPDDGVRLTTGQLARRLGVQKGTLRNWRMKGKGPRYIKAEGKFGAVAYRRCDVAAWEDAQSRNRTESEGPGGQPAGEPA